MNKMLIYSTRFMATKGYLLGSITLLDDWLKRDRFRITAILGAHLGTLGSAALVLPLVLIIWKIW